MIDWKLPEDWEPEILSIETIASGSWYYQNEIEYAVELIRRKTNYTSFELEEMHEKAIDFSTYNVSDEGVSYTWKFERKGAISETSSFSTYYEAMKHIKSYGCKYELSPVF